MPFMIGKAPIRRTLKYLEAGRLYLNKSIQIFSLNYNIGGDNHNGAREFVFWHLAQVQYKNPTVQVIAFRNLTPTPFIQCYYDNGKTMLIDIDGRNRSEILDHLIRVVGKSVTEQKSETLQKNIHDNRANFGVGCPQSCICTVPGQIPCPGIVPLPHHMRGKFRNANQ